MPTRAVNLTDDEVDLILESLEYSAAKFRDYNYGEVDRDWARTHRSERLELISETRAALQPRR